MKIIIPDLETNRTLDFLYQLDKMAVDDEVYLDASMKWVRPFGLLLASSALRSFRERHHDIPFHIIVGNTQGVDYAGHMGFFKSLSDKLPIGKNPGEAYGNDNYLPIEPLDISAIHQREVENGNYIEVGDVVEKEAKRLAQVLSHGDKETQVLFTYILREMIRNTPEHAETDRVWVCGQYWNDHTAEVAILDEGIGIKRSLQKNAIHREYVTSDEDALRIAVKAGISEAFSPSERNRSNDIWSNSGFGLYIVSELCKLLNGSFCLASGNKYLHINARGNVVLGNTWICGSAVKITVSTKNLSNSRKIIQQLSKQGEESAKNTRNAFKSASKPSKGLILE